MTNIFKLDDIRAEAERRYAPVVIETEAGPVQLKSILRLGTKDRDEVNEIVGEISNADDDQDDDETYEMICLVAGQIFEKIADKPKRLLKALEHDDLQVKSHLHMKVLSGWMGSSQLGEAESSPS